MARSLARIARAVNPSSALLTCTRHRTRQFSCEAGAVPFWGSTTYDGEEDIEQDEEEAKWEAAVIPETYKGAFVPPPPPMPDF